ncbi:hypothetical protein AMTR_s00090p00086710 [Amborella trichopoda]|uniref:Uncharacterized protein n=1 Tax=Amborella trichopoda TaxID=13333 RepID=W1P3U6_AMBTC|nr:hypothetical protein AMTR_s00090p00086710 [Amborella trichopoda]
MTHHFKIMVIDFEKKNQVWYGFSKDLARHDVIVSDDVRKEEWKAIDTPFRIRFKGQFVQW